MNGAWRRWHRTQRSRRRSHLNEVRMATIEEITARLQGMSESELDQVRTFVEFVRRKESGTQAAAWCFDFLENFRDASISAARDPAGMEVKVADAVCGKVTRLALWEHPPVAGFGMVAYVVAIPTGLRNV